MGHPVRNVRDSRRTQVGSHWIEARTPATLIACREEILSSGVGGTTIDHETILEELGIENDADITDRDLEALWFDRCMRTLVDHFADGTGIVHRAVGVDDPEAFATEIWAGADAGYHWTSVMECASTAYHAEAARAHDVLVTGTTTIGDVCWGTTIQKLFAHPHEREIAVNGIVVPTEIVHMTTGLRYERRLASAD